jgi:hypothetical protein
VCRLRFLPEEEHENDDDDNQYQEPTTDIHGELRSFRCGVRRSRWGGQPQHAPLGHRYLSGKPAQDRRVTGDEGRDFSGSTGGVFCRTLPDNQRRPERIR